MGGNLCSCRSCTLLLRFKHHTKLDLKLKSQEPWFGGAHDNQPALLVRVTPLENSSCRNLIRSFLIRQFRFGTEDDICVCTSLFPIMTPEQALYFLLFHPICQKPCTTPQTSSINCFLFAFLPQDFCRRECMLIERD